MTHLSPLHLDRRTAARLGSLARERATLKLGLRDGQGGSGVVRHLARPLSSE